MALYHFHVGQIKRSAGRSAVEAAAYRAGEKLYSEYYGLVSDYTRKGGVIHSEVLLPPHAPREYADRQALWNAVEDAERNRNAQLAYSFDIALQNEFTMEENISLARQFLLDNFVSRGMIADFAVHQPDKDGGIPNPHFHVMCPIRPLNTDGTWGVKQRRVYRDDGKFDAVPTTDWGKPETLEAWREAWAALCNAKFEEKGLTCRIDHRSYERQGVEQIPTVHEGVAVRQMKAKGIVTDKGEHNRWIRSASAMLRTLGERMKKLVDWLSDARVKLDKPYSPSLAKLLADYFDARNAGAWSSKVKVGNLKRLTSAIAYLNENGLHTLADLEAHLDLLHSSLDEAKTALDANKKRSKELRELLKHAGLYERFKPLHDQLRAIKWKSKREQFKAEHESELRQFYLARRKLSDGIHTAEWQHELDTRARKRRCLRLVQNPPRRADQADGREVLRRPGDGREGGKRSRNATFNTKGSRFGRTLNVGIAFIRDVEYNTYYGGAFMGLMSAKAAGEKWGISQRRVAVLCSENRIPGAIMIGHSWVIPDDAKKPDDARSTRRENEVETKVKPFLKWAGGKGQLLAEIEKYYPFDGMNITKYAEPFVGGGAVLFDILSRYSLEAVYISDINAELINAYAAIRDCPDRLIGLLKDMQDEYIPLDAGARREYYASSRARFNNLKAGTVESGEPELAALMIFLNRTCFNGLYRVNRKGWFNVPIGSYKNPMICDEPNLRAVSEKLQGVEIVCGDYRQSADFIDEHTFAYFDPPYRPLTETANFTSYTEAEFSDEEQIELARFVDEMSKKGAKVLASNSDPKNANENDDFFDEIYSAHNICRVKASRMINSNSSARGKISELLISNF